MVVKGWVKPSPSLVVAILFHIHLLVRYKYDYYICHKLSDCIFTACSYEKVYKGGKTDGW